MTTEINHITTTTTTTPINNNDNNNNNSRSSGDMSNTSISGRNNNINMRNHHITRNSSSIYYGLFKVPIFTCILMENYSMADFLLNYGKETLKQRRRRIDNYIINRNDKYKYNRHYLHYDDSMNENEKDHRNERRQQQQDDLWIKSTKTETEAAHIDYCIPDFYVMYSQFKKEYDFGDVIHYLKRLGRLTPRRLQYILSRRFPLAMVNTFILHDLVLYCIEDDQEDLHDNRHIHVNTDTDSSTTSTSTSTSTSPAVLNPIKSSWEYRGYRECHPHHQDQDRLCLLEVLFRHIIFDTNFILTCLQYYKNGRRSHPEHKNTNNDKGNINSNSNNNDNGNNNHGNNNNTNNNGNMKREGEGKGEGEVQRGRCGCSGGGDCCRAGLSLSTQELEDMIRREKRKIEVKERMYEQLYHHYHHHHHHHHCHCHYHGQQHQELVKLLLQYDGSEREELLQRKRKYLII
ncbi:hypothetical protein U3516DRAFT_899437 [Neocallimastix sp. 'constans']